MRDDFLDKFTIKPVSHEELGELAKTPPNSGSYTVLVVDDESLMLRAVRRMLRGSKHAVWSVPMALTAEEAIKKMDEQRLSVVLTDWNPHGLAVVTAARSRGIPVVAMTGEVNAAVEGLLDEYSDAIIVAKPFSLEVLEDNLFEAMSK
jgi:CheY-like chemotaxis protein